MERHEHGDPGFWFPYIPQQQPNTKKKKKPMAIGLTWFLPLPSVLTGLCSGQLTIFCGGCNASRRDISLGRCQETISRAN